jgi:DNA-binding CsgD family transcriptional regulator
MAEVMALTYDGYSPSEIARIISVAHGLTVTPDAVRGSLLQARKKLRLLLGREVTGRD